MNWDQPGEIIIVGAGVTGLSLARQLAGRGFKVTILEAEPRTGGRIHTLRNGAFSHPVELGVEFIHGKLPLTFGLLEEASIRTVPVGGTMMRNVNGKMTPQDDFALDWGELMEKMNELRVDMTMDEFLDRYFAGSTYEDVRKSVTRFAEGFDLADTSRAAVLALREEWMGDEDEQFRVPGGIDQLTDFLEKKCLDAGCTIVTSTEVTEIRWRPGEVTAITPIGNFQARRAAITVSLGQLQKGAITFSPPIDSKNNAFQQIGWGTAVRILLEFRSAFWKEKYSRLGFILSEEAVPTWWTQAPSEFPLLTGWAGGPQAVRLLDRTNEEILDVALESLSGIFSEPVTVLRDMLKASAIANWHRFEHFSGAYSYSLVGTMAAVNELRSPVDDTIFFVGEACYHGPSPGTVEAALVSARDVAASIVEKMERSS